MCIRDRLKDPEFIDGFRGIYMPYWTYYVTQKAPISLPAKRSHRSGDYIITDHYRLEGDLDAYYKGLSYDCLLYTSKAYLLPLCLWNFSFPVHSAQHIFLTHRFL